MIAEAYNIAVFVAMLSGIGFASRTGNLLWLALGIPWALTMADLVSEGCFQLTLFLVLAFFVGVLVDRGYRAKLSERPLSDG